MDVVVVAPLREELVEEKLSSKLSILSIRPFGRFFVGFSGVLFVSMNLVINLSNLSWNPWQN